jgi:TPR repeat protein
LKGATHYDKLVADQGIAVAQNHYEVCLQDGKGVGIAFKGAAHYFELTADQGSAEANGYMADVFSMESKLQRI